MNNNRLFRTAGWCALASAILIILSMVSWMIGLNVGGYLEIICLLLMGVVFYALYVTHRSEAKGLALAGVIFMIAAIVVEGFAMSNYGNLTLSNLWYLLFSLPFLIFAYLGFRSARMSRWLAVLALVTGGLTFIAAVVGFLGNPDLSDGIETLSIPFMLVWEVWLWRVFLSKKFAAASPVPAVA
jgi:hypothetical protein